MLKPTPWLLTLAFGVGFAMPQGVQAQAAPAPPSAPTTQDAPVTAGGGTPTAKRTTHHSSKHRHRHKAHHSSHKARQHHTPAATSRHHTPAATPAQTQPTPQN
jgi:hypothetical protein